MSSRASTCSQPNHKRARYEMDNSESGPQLSWDVKVLIHCIEGGKKEPKNALTFDAQFTANDSPCQSLLSLVLIIDSVMSYSREFA